MSEHCGCEPNCRLEGLEVRTWVERSPCRYPAALEAIRGLREAVKNITGTRWEHVQSRYATAILKGTEPYEVK